MCVESHFRASDATQELRHSLAVSQTCLGFTEAALFIETRRHILPAVWKREGVIMFAM